MVLDVKKKYQEVSIKGRKEKHDLTIWCLIEADLEGETKKIEYLGKHKSLCIVYTTKEKRSHPIRESQCVTD